MTEKNAPKRPSVPSLRALARAALRQRLPFLLNVAAGNEPGTRPADHAAAQRIIDQLRAQHGRDFDTWTRDL